MKPFKYIFLSVFIVGVLITNAQTIYVDAANNTGVEDGSQQHPFNTIKEGINAAVPGAIVMILQGAYIPDDSWSGNDHTLLLKAGVKLVGESPENTLVDGIIVDQEVSNLSITLENISFSEFHFTRGTIAGPFNDKNIIRNCSTSLISMAFGPGIPVNDSTPGPNYSFLIENNNLGTEGVIEFLNGNGVSEMSVLNNTCGYISIKCGSGYNILIDNNEVEYGILDKSAINPTIISNNRINNGGILDYSGGNPDGIEDEIIRDNIIIAAESSPVFIDEDHKAGIIAKSRSVSIRNNTITCTGQVSGIRSTAGAPLHMNNNIITLDEVQVPNPDPVEGITGIFNYSGAGTVTGNNIFGGQSGYFSKAATVTFADNFIQKAFTGFYSMGDEEVRNNTIKDCKGDGMVLDGVRGPVHDNVIKNNTGSGVHLLRVPIDLGGGADACPGNNVIMGNGNFDLYIETQSAQYPVLFARYNVWDHTDPADISFYDIRDSNDSTGLVTVDFTPFAYLGVEDESKEAWGLGGMDIYPNPAQELIHGRLNMDDGRFNIYLGLVIYDVLGRIVSAKTISGGQEEWTINISSLSPGVYIVSYNDKENRIFSGKFLKSLY
jgi:hypothetical protein